MYRAGFTPKTVDVGDFQFCYMERGIPTDTNQTIVLIHGFSASKDAWCYMSHALPKTEHIIALDLPGHGKSTRKHDGDHTIPTQVTKLHQVCMLLNIANFFLVYEGQLPYRIIKKHSNIHSKHSIDYGHQRGSE